MDHVFFPCCTDTHAFIQFLSYIRERSLPYITFLEFPLNSEAKGFRNDLEEVLHSLLAIGLSNMRVKPYIAKSMSNSTDVSSDCSKWGIVQFLEMSLDWSQMFADVLCHFAQLFISLRIQKLIFKILPDINFIHRFQYTSE